MKERTIIALLVRIYVLAGLLRIGVVALDSLADMTNTVQINKGVSPRHPHEMLIGRNMK